MECKLTFTKRNRSGETLAAMLVAMGLVGLLLGAVGSGYLFSARSFASLALNVDLDARSRMALDSMSREIRQAQRVTAYATNELTVLVGTNQVTYRHSSGSKTLVRVLGGASQKLLSDCDYLRFDLFQRNLTNGNYDYYPTASATNCKVVQVSWVCSRDVLGHKTQSAAVESAKVVIRQQK